MIETFIFQSGCRVLSQIPSQKLPSLVFISIKKDLPRCIASSASAKYVLVADSTRGNDLCHRACFRTTRDLQLKVVLAPAGVNYRIDSYGQ